MTQQRSGKIIQPLVRNYRAHKFLLVAMLVFMYIPIFIIILVSFNVDPYSLFPYVFTTDHYTKVIAGTYNESLLNSLKIGIGSGLISMTMGAAGAWALTRYEFRFKFAVGALFILPLVVPTLVTGIGSALFHEQFTNLPRGLALATITQSVRGISFGFLIMMAQMTQYPVELDRAAEVYGASLLQRVKEITIPKIWGALLGAFLISTIIAFNNYNLTFFTIGAKSTIPTLTFTQMKFGLSGSLFALSAIVAILSVAIVLSLSFLIEFSSIVKSDEE